MKDQVIIVDNLSKKYTLGKKKEGDLRSTISNLFKNKKTESEEFWALKDVSFEVNKGDVLGIVGSNGAGKSTLLKILSKITPPTSGKAIIKGRISSLLEVGTGFHPELSGRENVYLNGTLLGMKRREIKKKFDEIVAFSGIEKFIDTPVKNYSSGMYVRLAFAVAAHLEPEILLIDEVLAVGDIDFQRKCIGKMKEVSTQGRTVIFISHNLSTIDSLCNKGIWIQNGQVKSKGDIKTIISLYIESTFKQTQLNILDRKDIDPSYPLRITDIEIVGLERKKYLPAGNALSIKLSYTSNTELKNVICKLTCKDYMGKVIFVLNNKISNGSFEVIPNTGKLICKIPSMFLNAGRYKFDIIIKSHRINIFKLEDTFSLTVSSSDYYKTGIMPHIGNVIIDYDWSYE